jgi:hypothetical protein
VKLSNEDHRAIDLLLERGSAASASATGSALSSADGMSSASGYLSHAAPVNPNSLRAVQQVFDLLNMLPPEEPPADLLQRTLDRIDQSVSGVSEPAPFRSVGGTMHA